METDDLQNDKDVLRLERGYQALPYRNTYRRVRVMLLDDHPVVRLGLSAQLTQMGDVALMGDFETSRDLLRALSQHEIDVLVMDYSLGPKDMDGIRLLRMLRVRFPNLEILVISSRDDPATAAMALRAGARGYMTKAESMTALTEAVRSVAAHRRYVAPMLAYDLSVLLPRVAADGHSKKSGNAPANGIQLSPRELEVLRCLIGGMAVKDIAAKFSRSINTISTQKQSAYRKLGIRSDIELGLVKDRLGELA